MEEIIEQPTLETSNSDTSISNENLEIQEGSMLGKFKDAKSLLDAYTGLEAEFTRKCQKLSEVQKEYDTLSKKAALESYESVDDFVSRNADMDKYKKEITEILTNDEVSNLPNKYQVAYLIAKQTESESAKKLNDPEFLDKEIKENPKIREKIIFDYLSNLNKSQPAPNVMTGNSASVFFSPQASVPKTIREAGELFSKMFK